MVDPDALHHRFRIPARFARRVDASVEIDAPRRVVWSVITDLARYPEWNPFTTRVDGELVLGTSVLVHVRMPRRGRLRQRLWVNRIDAQERICWGMQMGHRVLLGNNRFQELQALGPDRTRYLTSDRFGGWLSPLVVLLFGGPMQTGFDRHVQALKLRAEALHQASGGDASDEVG